MTFEKALLQCKFIYLSSVLTIFHYILPNGVSWMRCTMMAVSAFVVGLFSKTTCRENS